MPRGLFVGDVHAVAAELEECRRLIDLVESTAVAQDVDFICFLGDLYHNHAVIDAEVQLFWHQTFKRLDEWPIIVVNGNHDSPNNKASQASALVAHLNDATIVLKPTEYAGLLFCPYTWSQDELVRWSHLSNAKTMVCHGTFKGATYENGIPAHDYFDQSLLKQATIISGHIHTPMELSGSPKVIYTGAPRWRSVKDANVERSLRVFTVQDGKIVRDIHVDTSTACSPMYVLEDTEDAPLSLEPKGNAKYVIDVRGTEQWVNARRSLYPYARVRPYPTHKVAKLKESEGLTVSLGKWFDQFKTPNNTDKSSILERINKIWPIHTKN